MWWSNKFTLLATFEQFNVVSQAWEYQTTCLLLYWKQADLENMVSTLGDSMGRDAAS